MTMLSHQSEGAAAEVELHAAGQPHSSQQAPVQASVHPVAAASEAQSLHHSAPGQSFHVQQQQQFSVESHRVVLLQSEAFPGSVEQGGGASAAGVPCTSTQTGATTHSSPTQGIAASPHAAAAPASMPHCSDAEQGQRSPSLSVAMQAHALAAMQARAAAAMPLGATAPGDVEQGKAAAAQLTRTPPSPPSAPCLRRGSMDLEQGEGPVATASKHRESGDGSAAHTCWICLCGEDEGELTLPCKCVHMYSHPHCLARWQLHQHGKDEEVACRFCKAPLPSWTDTLATLEQPIKLPSYRYQRHLRQDPALHELEPQYSPSAMNGLAWRRRVWLCGVLLVCIIIAILSIFSVRWFKKD